MSRVLTRIALLALALLALTTPAAAQSPPPPAPTLTLEHLGPNEVPGPWLLAVTVQHTTGIRVTCAGADTPARALRNPFPSQPTTWEFASTTPLCPGEVEVELDAIGPDDPPPARFGPFAHTGGAYVRSGTPARVVASTIHLPLLARPLVATAALDASGAAVVAWQAPGAARACVTRLSDPPAALGCADASPWRQGPSVDGVHRLRAGDTLRVAVYAAGRAAPLATRQILVAAR